MSRSDIDLKNAEIIYGLESRPPFAISTFAALQHLMAMFVGIITPPIIIAQTLGLPLEMKAYLISIALFVGGIGTFMQVSMWGPIGSGLLSMQGVSFIFLGTVIGIGLSVKERGGSPEDIIPPPVLGGATLLLFGTVAAAGIKIIAATRIDRRAMIIMG
ncbi:MAG: hypothetical protein K2O70_08950, partial [Desulfovibrionaceae bacterium]|nr:hypothetical protein [Desulfovibrionaceae bacterium]